MKAGNTKSLSTAARASRLPARILAASSSCAAPPSSCRSSKQHVRWHPHFAPALPTPPPDKPSTPRRRGIVLDLLATPRNASRRWISLTLRYLRRLCLPKRIMVMRFGKHRHTAGRLCTSSRWMAAAMPALATLSLLSRHSLAAILPLSPLSPDRAARPPPRSARPSPARSPGR